MARPRAPWPVWNFAPRVHPILFVHRVAGLEPGLYALPRARRSHGAVATISSTRISSGRASRKRRTTCRFILLKTGDARGAARRLFCNQAIASDCCFGMAMLAEFDAVAQNPWTYRGLHWEAGLIGQALYLEAERFGLRGTGVGCFFDDETHDFIGLKSAELQTIYHFTLGAAAARIRASRPSPPIPTSNAQRRISP